MNELCKVNSVNQTLAARYQRQAVNHHGLIMKRNLFSRLGQIVLTIPREQTILVQRYFTELIGLVFCHEIPENINNPSAWWNFYWHPKLTISSSKNIFLAAFIFMLKNSERFSVFFANTVFVISRSRLTCVWLIKSPEITILTNVRPSDTNL